MINIDLVELVAGVVGTVTKASRRKRRGAKNALWRGEKGVPNPADRDPRRIVVYSMDRDESAATVRELNRHDVVRVRENLERERRVRKLAAADRAGAKPIERVNDGSGIGSGAEEDSCKNEKSAYRCFHVPFCRSVRPNVEGFWFEKTAGEISSQ
jgi:hypothetical protein